MGLRVSNELSTLSLCRLSKETWLERCRSWVVSTLAEIESSGSTDSPLFAIWTFGWKDYFVRAGVGGGLECNYDNDDGET